MTESFAQLFEQSLANQRIRPGMILTGLVVDVTDDVVIVNVGLKSEAVIPARTVQERARRARSQGRRRGRSRARFGRGRLRRDAPVARESQARPHLDPPRGRIQQVARSSPASSPAASRAASPSRSTNVRAFLPGSLVDVRPVRDTVLPRRQAARVQGHQARPEAQQRRGLAPRGGRAGIHRRAQRAHGQPAGRRGRQGRGQEPHRLRCVRRPGRHRWPAAHHRHGVEARQASVGSRQGRRRDRRADPQVRPRALARLAGPEAARRGSVGRTSRAATRPTRACSARSPTSPTTAASSRSRRASKAWCTSPRWTGPTRTSTRPRSCTSARKSRSWCWTSTRSAAASRSA